MRGEQAHEGGLADDQLRLQHAVGQRADDAQADGRMALGREREVVADAEVQHVHQRRLIGDRRDRAIVERAVQQPPRVGALFRRRRHRRGEREARLSSRKRGSGAMMRGLVGR